jgi:hypothetical protein
MSETYKEENEINAVEQQKDKDIQLILELKKLKWSLEQDGYLPTLDEAIVRIMRKWEVEDDFDWAHDRNCELERDHADEFEPAEDNDPIQ